MGAICVFCVAAVAWEVLGPGLLLLAVHNRSERTLSSVVVSSPHARVELGGIRPGRSRLIVVPGLGEGGLKILLRDTAGRTDSVEAPVYLQPESKGYLRLEMRHAGVPPAWQRWMAPFWNV